MNYRPRRHHCPPLMTVILATVSVCANAVELPRLECLIEPNLVVDVGSPTHGIVDTLAVDRSDIVDEQTVLAKLDSTQQAAAVRKAKVRAAMQSEVRTREAELALAERKQQRMRELYNSDAISSHQRDEVETELKRAQLQLRQARDAQSLARIELERARDELTRRTIRSPISGVVVERFVAAGEYVNEKPLMRIAQMHPLRVEALAPASLFGQVRPGMQARITLESGEEPYEAQVTIVDRMIDAASGTFGIRLRLPNPDYAIPSGLNCNVELIAAADSPPEAPRVEVAATTVKSGARTAAPVPAVDRSAATKLSATVQPTVSETPVCRSFGPLYDDARQRTLATELGRYAVDLRTRSEPGKVPAGFFALTEAYSSVAAARAAARVLQERGIGDLAVLTRPPFRGRISLGLFDRRHNAEQRRDELARQDIAVVIEPRSINGEVRWIDADLPPSSLAREPWRERVRGIDVSACPDTHYVASNARPRVSDQ